VKTLLQFFSGTLGVILAIVFCGFMSIMACVIGSGVVVAIAGTPTP